MAKIVSVRNEPAAAHQRQRVMTTQRTEIGDRFLARVSEFMGAVWSDPSDESVESQVQALALASFNFREEVRAQRVREQPS